MEDKVKQTAVKVIYDKCTKCGACVLIREKERICESCLIKTKDIISKILNR